jgi:hypothetical protein
MSALSALQVIVLRALADGQVHERAPEWNGASLNALRKSGLIEAGYRITEERWHCGDALIEETTRHHFLYRITAEGRRALNDERRGAAA